MFSRLSAGAILIAGLLSLTATTITAQTGALSKADKAKAKKAIQELQEYIGQWNVEGLQKVGGKTDAWKEKIEWSWKFDKEDKDNAWIVLKIEKGKYYSGGEIKYLPSKKKYEMTLTPADKSAPQVFEGDLVRGTMNLTHTAPGSGDVIRLKVNTAAGGIRYLALLEKQDKGKGPFSEMYKQNGTKEGESFAAGAKKPECVVTGGAATIAVGYNGKTYYVCCSGCRDEFNANPAKIIAEFEKKNK